MGLSWDKNNTICKLCFIIELFVVLSLAPPTSEFGHWGHQAMSPQPSDDGVTSDCKNDEAKPNQFEAFIGAFYNLKQNVIIKIKL